MTLHVRHLGLVEYQDGLALQSLVGQARQRDLLPDTLLLLQHPPVLTMGRGAKPENILFSREALRAEGVEVFQTSRGGDVTYHGPGQLVGYPIIKLPPGRQDVRRYVRDLEELIIRALGRFEIAASRIPRWTGVWVGDEAQGTAEKIAALGVHLSRWQSSHGFALNVDPNLGHFRFIVPCGIREAGVTSMARVLGRPLDFDQVAQAVERAFVEVFDARSEPVPAPARTVCVVVTRASSSGLELLLLKRTEARGGFWQPVTGRIEPGESAEQAARRELFEEVGAVGQPRPLGYRHSFAFGEDLPPKLFDETAFSAQLGSDFEVRLSDEHEAFEWVSQAIALERVPFPGLRRAISLALR